MQEVGRVFSLNGNMAKIEIRRVSACGDSCASCKGGCAPKSTFVEAMNEIGAATGQAVEIEMKTDVVFGAVILNYGLPLLMLIIGIFGGNALAERMNLGISKDIIAVLTGFGLMAISYIFAHQMDKKYKKAEKVNFKVTRIVD